MSGYNPPIFVYFIKQSGYAIAMTSRDDLSTNVLLFTCPMDWKPKNQQEFNDAARYYGVQKPEAMKYDPEEVPF